MRLWNALGKQRGRRPLSLFNSAAGAAAAFNPLSVSPIIWTDTSDMSTLFQDSAGTTPVTADGQPVGRISDKSGNGNHLLQATADNRGLYRSGGYIDLDGVDDGYDTASGRTFPATMELFVAMRNISDTNFMLMYATAESGAGFVGTAASGDGSSTQGGGFGTPTTYVDGVLLSPDTRGNLLTQLGTNAGKVVEFRGLTTGTKSQLSFYKYSAGFQFLGRAHGMMLTPPLTEEQRVQVRAYLAAQLEPAPVTAPIALTNEPQVRLHPQYSTVTTSGGRVTNAVDLKGLANAIEGSTGVGPLELTDTLGRKFWRFDNAQWMAIADTLSIASVRNCTIAMVVRTPRNAGALLGLGRSGFTPPNTGSAMVGTYLSGSIGPMLRPGNMIPTTNKSQMYLGAQLQVLINNSRDTAGGGQRGFVNTEFSDCPQNGTAVASVGAEIARFPFSAGATGSWGVFDLYELLIYTSALTPANAVTLASELKTGWGIATIEDQLILAGDSITHGHTYTPVAESLGKILTDPGKAWQLPARVRVINNAVSGSMTSNLLAIRAANDSAFDDDCRLTAGHNYVFMQIGVNDAGSAGNTLYTPTVANTVERAAAIYTKYVELINQVGTAPAEGYLQKGFKVFVGLNIATNSGIATTVTELVRLLRLPQFLTDTLSNTGQLYEGKVVLVDLPAWMDGAVAPFATTSATYYSADNIHLITAGTLEYGKAIHAGVTGKI